ncbi:MAG: hypothetical protein A2156_06305 [Deltaproteobacteria bacterium RBG_16_48_10]|nr:MAG: hypothetical protein A2156_06305 [Deltaproteobacteria bacterium RBG_16_48_10]
MKPHAPPEAIRDAPLMTRGICVWKVQVIGGQGIEKGETVTIRGIRGLTLLVEHGDDGNPLD